MNLIKINGDLINLDNIVCVRWQSASTYPNESHLTEGLTIYSIATIGTEDVFTPIWRSATPSAKLAYEKLSAWVAFDFDAMVKEESEKAE